MSTKPSTLRYFLLAITLFALLLLSVTTIQVSKLDAQDDDPVDQEASADLNADADKGEVADETEVDSEVEAPAAQGGVRLSETTLRFEGIYSEPMSRTVTLEVAGEPVENGVVVVRDDLVDEDTGNVILSNEITVEPTEFEGPVNNYQTFEITIPAVSHPGHYVGDIAMKYGDHSEANTLTLRLDVTAQSVPSVAADVNSQNVTISVQQPWDDIPFFGRPAANIISNPQAETLINLLQRSEGEAVVENVHVLTMRRTDGGVLPDNVVQIKADFPETIDSGGSLPLRVVFSGKNIEAGEYNGLLLATVRNQAQPVEIPLKVQVKHGLLLPLLMLIFGISAAVILKVWSERGEGAIGLAKQVRMAAKGIQEGDKLQAVTRDELISLLGQAMRDIEAGKPVEEIRAKLEEVRQKEDAVRQETNSFLQEVQQQLDRVRVLRPACKVRKNIIEGLERLQEDITNGKKYRSLNDARHVLETDAKFGIDDLELLLDEYNKWLVDAQKKEAARAIEVKLTNAEKIVEIHDIMKTVDDPPVISFDSISYDGGTVPEKEEVEAISDTFTLKYTTRLRLGVFQTSAVLFVYVFTLVVGFVNLYVSNPTFGADPAQYIPLFLWGATIEAVRGQAITLTHLGTLVDK